MVYVDAHCHLHDFNEKRIEFFLKQKLIIVSVSEDLETSRKTLFLSSEHNNIYGCVGIHPWEVGKLPRSQVKEVEKLAEKADCVGEVGLDKKFVPQTWHKQIPIFQRMVDLALELDLPLNVHAAGAWHEIIEILEHKGVTKAIIHWYTGPLDLLDKICELGYFITVNPSIKFQRKQRIVVEKAPMNILLTESDGPYNYRGMFLEPTLVKEAIKEIALLKNMSQTEVEKGVEENFRRILK